MTSVSEENKVEDTYADDDSRLREQARAKSRAIRHTELLKKYEPDSWWKGD